MESNDGIENGMEEWTSSWHCSIYSGKLRHGTCHFCTRYTGFIKISNAYRNLKDQMKLDLCICEALICTHLSADVNYIKLPLWNRQAQVWISVWTRSKSSGVAVKDHGDKPVSIHAHQECHSDDWIDTAQMLLVMSKVFFFFLIKFAAPRQVTTKIAEVASIIGCTSSKIKLVEYK